MIEKLYKLQQIYFLQIFAEKKSTVKILWYEQRSLYIVGLSLYPGSLGTGLS